MDSTDDAPSSDPPSTARLIGSEAAGTALVMLAGPGLMVLSGGAAGRLEVAVAFGLAMALSIGVIGAVANPVFSFALWVGRQIPGRELIADVVGQLIGGVAGAAVVFAIDEAERTPWAANGWDRSTFAGLGSVLSAELVFSLVVTTVLLLATTQLAGRGSIALATGAAYALAMLVLVPLDGGGINPARSIGSALFADGDPHPLSQLWAFVVAPVVGGFAAVFAWLALDDTTVDDTRLDDTVVDDIADAIIGDG